MYLYVCLSFVIFGFRFLIRKSAVSLNTALKAIVTGFDVCVYSVMNVGLRRVSKGPWAKGI